MPILDEIYLPSDDVVDEEDHVRGRPDELKQVEGLGEISCVNWTLVIEGIAKGNSLVTIVRPRVREMERRRDEAGRTSVALHYVNLPGGRPTAVNRILRHHPDRWPETESGGELRADSKATVLP